MSLSGNPCDSTPFVDLSDTNPSSPILVVSQSSPDNTGLRSVENYVTIHPMVSPGVNMTVEQTSILKSYRDILLAHIPIYSDKVSIKYGIIPIGSSHHQNVSIRRKKGKDVGGEGVSGDTRQVSHPPTHIPLSSRLSSVSSPVTPGALREQPPINVT